MFVAKKEKTKNVCYIRLFQDLHNIKDHINLFQNYKKIFKTLEISAVETDEQTNVHLVIDRQR